MDRSQRELERIFEKRYILKEETKIPGMGNITSDKLYTKPLHEIISIIVGLIDLGLDVPPQAINRIVGEGKQDELIAAIHNKRLNVPEEVAHALESDLDTDIPVDSDEVDVSPEDYSPKELDLSAPRFNEIPDEERDEDEDESIKIDPAL
jgi:hypothetical protein